MTVARPVQKDDLFRLRFLQGGRLSPDARWIAYAVSSTDAAKETETCAIHVLSLETGESRQVTAGTAYDTNPQWSPDGRTLAFTSTRSGAPQVYLLPVAGGEARPLTAMKTGVGGGPLWSPDGSWIAFTSHAADPRDPRLPYRVTRRIYRLDGAGYIDDVVQDIYIIPVAGGEPRRLTTDPAMKQISAWSPDGTRLLVQVALRPDAAEPTMDLQTVDMDGQVRDLLRDWGGIGGAAWTPDGLRIAFTGQPSGRIIGSKSDLWVVDAGGGTPACRTASLAPGIGGAVQPDMPIMGLMREPLHVERDGQSALALVQEHGTAGMYRVSLNGPERWERLFSGERTVVALDAQGERVLLAETDFSTPPELVIAGADGAGERRLTHLNDDLLGGWMLPTPERLHFAGVDGVQVEGFLLKPPIGTPPYPTILDIHGGPHSANGPTFDFNAQMLCGAGFAVLYINYRGSSGYGDAFGTGLYGALGDKDYKDLMSGVDHAVAAGLVDPDRLGSFGISQGGFLTLFIVGQTGRFKGAVAEEPVSDWTTYYGVTDIGHAYATRSLRGTPHEAPEAYRRGSPITFAHRCTTPTLLIQGENDYRTTTAQSEQFYATLKANGCVVEMLRFPGASHIGSIAGAIAVRKAENDALREWMERWVLGKQQHAR